MPLADTILEQFEIADSYSTDINEYCTLLIVDDIYLMWGKLLLSSIQYCRWTEADRIGLSRKVAYVMSEQWPKAQRQRCISSLSLCRHQELRTYMSLKTTKDWMNCTQRFAHYVGYAAEQSHGTPRADDEMMQITTDIHGDVESQNLLLDETVSYCAWKLEFRGPQPDN